MLKFRSTENTTPVRTLEPAFDSGVNQQSTRAGETAVRINTDIKTTATSVIAGQTSRKRRRTFGIPRKQAKIGAVVLLIAATTLGIRWNIANSNPTIPLPASTTNAPVTSTPDAGHFYQAATNAFDYASLSKYDPSEASLAEKKQIVQKTAESLRLWREGFKYQYQPINSNWKTIIRTVSGDISRSPYASVPELTNIQTIGNVFVTEAQVAASEGRYADAVNASLDAIRFGQDIGHGRSYILGCTGLFAQGSGVDEAIKHIGKLKADEARAAANRLENLISNEQSYTDVIEQDRQIDYDIMRRTFRTASGYPGMTFYTHWDTNPFQVQAMYDAAILRYGKDGIFQSYRQFMDEIHRQTQLPYQQGKQLPEVVPSISFLELGTGQYRRGWQEWVKRTTLKRILLAQLAVQAYQQEHGGMAPKTLIELTQGPKPYLKEAPVDLFTRGADKPLLIKDGKVYSVGENGTDDGNRRDDAEITKDW